ncbi:MAG TPA: ATP-binding protein [Desulfosporosinus sp.]|nr:ATP-binding protein [Desulfosporosinus sp.]
MSIAGAILKGGHWATELVIANKELAFQNEEKEKRAAELVIANIELAFQNDEKDKRAAELVIANIELAFQNDEKDKRAAELVIANIELAFQGKEKDKRAVEFITEHQHRLLEEKMARLDQLNLMGQMAAGIGHEIRNPMTTVRGYLQLLGGKPEYATRKPTFDLMISELDQANTIITEFLSLAPTKQTELKFQNLNDILSKSYPLIEGDTFTQNKQIILIPGQIPNLELNKKRITQLVLNLACNGLEAMQERGCLTIKSYVEDGKVVLAIEDEGCGIPPENIRKLGTPFFTTKDSGTGLGLATCYNIAQSHNAKVHVKSSSKGTTFFISFPVSES